MLSVQMIRFTNFSFYALLIPFYVHKEILKPAAGQFFAKSRRLLRS